MLCTVHENRWHDCISCFDLFRDMTFSNINASEKQAKYEQEEQKHFIQPSCQWRSPWFSFIPLVPANSCNYRRDALGDWSRDNNKKENFPFRPYPPLGGKELSKLSIYMPFCCHSFPFNRQVKFCLGKYVIWHDDLVKKPIWIPECWSNILKSIRPGTIHNDPTSHF